MDFTEYENGFFDSLTVVLSENGFFDALHFLFENGLLMFLAGIANQLFAVLALLPENGLFETEAEFENGFGDCAGLAFSDFWKILELELCDFEKGFEWKMFLGLLEIVKGFLRYNGLWEFRFDGRGSAFGIFCILKGSLISLGDVNGKLLINSKDGLPLASNTFSLLKPLNESLLSDVSDGYSELLS